MTSIYVVLCAVKLIIIAQMALSQDPNDYKTVSDFLHDYSKLKHAIYSNYPKLKATDKTFPPPTGSDVVEERLYGENLTAVVSRVNVLIQTQRIVMMDIEQQSVILKVKEMYFWRDKSLIWWNNRFNLTFEPHFMSFDRNKVWTPPIFAKNVLKEEIISDLGVVVCQLSGHCRMDKQVQYVVPCDVNVREFPFDVHNCTLLLSQPLNWHTRINFTIWWNKISLDEEKVGKWIFREEEQHQEWSLENWNNLVTPMEDFGSLNEFNYTIVLRRQAKFYFTVLVLPCILLNLLSLTIFTLPVTNTGRMDFCLALILTYFVLIMIVVDSSPPSGDQVPDLGLYIILCTGVTALTFGMSMALVEMHEHCREKRTRMPKLMSNILEKFFCLSERYTKYKMECESNSENEDNNEEKVENPERDESKTLMAKEKQELLDGKNDLNEENDLKEMFKWKLLGKVLNFFFMIITALAHVILPLAIFCN